MFSDGMIKSLDCLAENFGITIDWTSKNIVPYIQELMNKYIKWEIATSIFWICFCVIALIACIIILKLFITHDWDKIFIVFPIIFLGLAIFGVFGQIYDLIKCIYFPELQFIEHIKYLSRTVQ